MFFFIYIYIYYLATWNPNNTCCVGIPPGRFKAESQNLAPGLFSALLLFYCEGKATRRRWRFTRKGMEVLERGGESFLMGFEGPRREFLSSPPTLDCRFSTAASADAATSPQRRGGQHTRDGAVVHHGKKVAGLIPGGHGAFLCGVCVFSSWLCVPKKNPQKTHVA